MPRRDPFFDRQPPLDFVNGLRAPLWDKKPRGFGEREAEEAEYDCRGIYLNSHFPDLEGLLETAAEDFKRFAEICEIGGARYELRLEYEAGGAHESYRIVPSESLCRIIAADTEGARRGIFFIEDEFLSREGAFLGKEEIERAPTMRTRITRGFFSPTNRPPKNGDELSDDVDYYPDEYLNRIAHDGTNGIWIYTSFRALTSSSYIPEYDGAGSAARIKKLTAVVDKCARYGIKVYIFAMEPNYLLGDLAAAHPEMLGAAPFVEGHVSYHSVCPLTEAGRGYLVEATEKIFRAVPKLGGYIDITAGERLTTCASADHFSSCPRCSKLSRGAALAKSVDIIKEGIRRAGTGAEFISWTYAHREWKLDDVKDYVRHAPSDVMLMQNFEDLGYEEQLGKTREAIDYWLSYVGPSQLFRETARVANENGKHLFAKMQICCSHELATVPYIPAPGIIFDKYKTAHGWGVEGVMQCWYFGNYPSVMSRAAGELAFCNNFSDKRAFIEGLAALYVGKSRAAGLAEAFELFESAYVNYPINIMFSYYGPMHDGVVWELSLKPRDASLPRSWQLLDMPEGDRIHEALWQGHTLPEAITLVERISALWRRGMEKMKAYTDVELYTVAAALDILFASGLNILRFYSLRDELGRGVGSPREKLRLLEELVRTEIENSQAMKELCLQDARLGYHSEAEGFKFFPEKLDHRTESLKKLLSTEFPEVRERIEKGLAPLEFYRGRINGAIPAGAYFIKRCELNEAERASIGAEGDFALCYDDEHIFLDIDAPQGTTVHAAFEYRLLRPDTAIFFDESGIALHREAASHQSVFGDKRRETLSKYELTATKGEVRTHYLLKISRAKCGWRDDTPLRMKLQFGSSAYATSAWHTNGKYNGSLGKDTAPEDLGWIIPEKLL